MMSSTSAIARQAVRRFTTSAVRRSGHDPYDGVPGYNFPFSMKNRHVLLVKMMVYFGSGFAAPFILIRHHLQK